MRHALCLECQIPIERRREAICPGCASHFRQLKDAARKAAEDLKDAPHNRAALVASQIAEKAVEDFHQKILNEDRRRTIVHVNSQPHPRTVWKGKN